MRPASFRSAGTVRTRYKPPLHRRICARQRWGNRRRPARRRVRCVLMRCGSWAARFDSVANSPPAIFSSRAGRMQSARSATTGCARPTIGAVRLPEAAVGPVDGRSRTGGRPQRADGRGALWRWRHGGGGRHSDSGAAPPRPPLAAAHVLSGRRRDRSAAHGALGARARRRHRAARCAARRARSDCDVGTARAPGRRHGRRRGDGRGRR